MTCTARGAGPGEPIPSAGVASGSLSQRQGPGKVSEAVHLRIGTRRGDPGGTVSVPLQLEGTPKDGAAALDLEVAYPGARLVFAAIDPAGERIKAEAVPKESEPHTVSISLGSADGAAIPEGLLAYLVFRILEDAEPGKAVLAVKTAVRSSRSGPVPIEARDGLVEILPPPERSESEPQNLDPYIPACFFYMH